MNCSRTGQFYGDTHETIRLEGVTLTDTVYTQGRVPWHFHENNYFTFILEGGMTEGNKKEVYECRAGDLLFHNWQDAHYNIASGRFTRGFHVEVSDHWFQSFDRHNDLTEGSIRIGDPRIKGLMYNIIREMKLMGAGGRAAIDALLLELFGLLSDGKPIAKDRRPPWVSKLRELLHDSHEAWSLPALAQAVQVHPVHLSRYFTRYFGMGFGDYARTIKLQRAMTLLPDPALSLTDISLECGFADQSHFIRSFKSHYHITPLHYRKCLSRR
ncbi:helix-turn-helix transcriptional regulator [Paraflavitalea pollutisoli]|uniref:helix-turn-helix transcriptional regulator n=1 Tax=Paraflavitalea pollutisoli TaxID=3034143 RepID=UPI0023EC6C4E|nr:helix-turn-helix transcriptional regulator [Paraflavitalea sp. H1-2-19X]